MYDILKGFRLTYSVTRMGDLLHFGQLFQACGKNYFAQIAHIFIKVSKYLIFLVVSFLGKFIDIWRFFLVTLLTNIVP